MIAMGTYDCTVLNGPLMACRISTLQAAVIVPRGPIVSEDEIWSMNFANLQGGLE